MTKKKNLLTYIINSNPVFFTLFLYKYCYNVTNIVITLQKISKLYVLNDYKGAIQDYTKDIEINPGLPPIIVPVFKLDF